MDELEKNRPKLSKLKKEIPFGTPDKYFDDFSARLHTRLEAEKKVSPETQNPIFKFLKPALGLAASFALIFLLVYWPLNRFIPDQTGNQAKLNEINEMEYESLIEGIDENSFYALLDEPDGSEEFTDDDLISYLSVNISEYDIYYGTNNFK